jgi:crotonobetainyl-CoA:carnitine CoA-transferase CaiB-like acyl-CoA transferase
VASFEQMTDSAWVKSQELKVRVQHSYLGETDIYVAPFRYGGHPVGRALPAPLLGADTDSILATLLGMDTPRVQDLRAHDVLT